MSFKHARALVYAAVIGSAALASNATAARAQTILETPKATIEVIGLRRWTIAMIQDSLGKYAPDATLTGHACAAILRNKLHFADASVSTYIGYPSQTKEYVAITIVEPQDSSRIHYKAELKDSLPAPASWKAGYAAFMKDARLAQHALQSATFYAERLSPDDSVKYATLSPLHALLEHPTGKDFAAAIYALDHDANYEHRMMATVVLSSFWYNDSTWYALADAMRDPVGIVSATAGQVLSTLGRTNARPIDWRPMTERLRYMVDGTNLFATNGVMKALTRTNVSFELAGPLLADGGAIVLAKLRSGDSDSRDMAAGFLAQLSGKPVSTPADEFERWVHGLRANK